MSAKLFDPEAGTLHVSGHYKANELRALADWIDGYDPDKVSRPDPRQEIKRLNAVIDKLCSVMRFALQWLDEKKSPVAYGALKTALKEMGK